MRHAKVLVALSVSWFLLHGSRNEWNSDICWCVRTETLAPLCDDDPCQDDEVVLPPEGAAATMTVCENDSPKSEWTEKSMRSPDSMSNHEGHVIESPDSMLWSWHPPPTAALQSAWSDFQPISQRSLQGIELNELPKEHALPIYRYIYIYIYRFIYEYVDTILIRHRRQYLQFLQQVLQWGNTGYKVVENMMSLV